jgi:hypothetical protein
VAVVVNVAAGCIDFLSMLVDVTVEASSRLFVDISEFATALTDALSPPLLSAVSFSCGSLLSSCVMLLAFTSVVVAASVTASTVINVAAVAVVAVAVVVVVVALSRDLSFRSKVDVRLTNRSLPVSCKRESN